MGKDELLDDRVSARQCKKAVDALHTHASQKAQKAAETELLPRKDEFVWLTVAVKKMPEGKQSFKPTKVPIVHPLVDPRTSSICLIVKDPQREYKDLLESHDVKFISRVVGIEKLKGKFKPFEARRMLLKETAMFLADERVLPLLPKILGVKWFNAKKQPIPVNLKRKDVKGELERAISSTYMNQNRGTFTSVKIGTVSQATAQILANLKSALPVVAKRIVGGWDNIQSFGIKTNSSLNLPIWNCALGDGEGARWEGLTNDIDVEAEDEDETKATSSEEEPEPPKSAKKGKKRSAAVEEEKPDEEKPKKKKAKTSETITLKSAPSSSSKPAQPPVVEDDKPTSKKRKSAAAAPSDVNSKPKDRKAETTPAPSPSVVPPSDKRSKPKSRQVDDTSATSRTAVSRPPAKPDSTTVDVKEVPPVQAPISKSSKKKGDQGAVTSKKDKTELISRDEVKAKRSVGPGEKKKVKLAKGRVDGKSAKNALLGKKAGQES